MKVNHRKISSQVIVITGASSGIGLATAKMAAEKGAKVVLASRNSEALDQAVAEIQKQGGQALAVTADVGDPDQVQYIADRAIMEYGTVDTWVNNAGVSIYGKTWDIPLDDQKKLFDTNYWGVVHGSLVALPVLKENGGALINIGSVNSFRGLPLQSAYVASKQAINGFTEVLRMEVEKENLPVSVTLIEPAAIATPFAEHARNYMDEEASLPPVKYAPEVVARAILDSAEHTRRTVKVGGTAKALSVMSTLSPRLTDLVMEQSLFGQQKDSKRAKSSSDSLESPSDSAPHEEGKNSDSSRHRSFYTMATRNRKKLAALAGSAAAALASNRYLRKRASH